MYFSSDSLSCQYVLQASTVDKVAICTQRYADPEIALTPPRATGINVMTVSESQL